MRARFVAKPNKTMVQTTAACLMSFVYVRDEMMIRCIAPSHALLLLPAIRISNSPCLVGFVLRVNCTPGLQICPEISPRSLNSQIVHLGL